MVELQFTKAEYDCLLAMLKRPRTWEELKKIAKTEEQDTMNIMLSRMGDLYSVIDDKPITNGKLKLNQIGLTVAQAEFDRRFDMYYTRIMSGAALSVSILALIFSLL